VCQIRKMRCHLYVCKSVIYMCVRSIHFACLCFYDFRFDFETLLTVWCFIFYFLFFIGLLVFSNYIYNHHVWYRSSHLESRQTHIFNRPISDEPTSIKIENTLGAVAQLFDLLPCIWLDGRKLMKGFLIWHHMGCRKMLIHCKN
jgi:hypothetical protein